MRRVRAVRIPAFFDRKNLPCLAPVELPAPTNVKQNSGNPELPCGRSTDSPYAAVAVSSLGAGCDTKWHNGTQYLPRPLMPQIVKTIIANCAKANS
jgi:hypothetical protein